MAIEYQAVLQTCRDMLDSFGTSQISLRKRCRVMGPRSLATGFGLCFLPSSSRFWVLFCSQIAADQIRVPHCAKLACSHQDCMMARVNRIAHMFHELFCSKRVGSFAEHSVGQLQRTRHEHAMNGCKDQSRNSKSLTTKAVPCHGPAPGPSHRVCMARKSKEEAAWIELKRGQTSAVLKICEAVMFGATSCVIYSMMV